jgi:hypothetical protein
MAEPTSALTYGDLVLAVAEQLGVAYYGANGDQAAQVPVDPFTLDKCTRYVQDGIRMAIADCPPNGWRWQRPLAEIDIWQDVGIQMPSGSAGPELVSSRTVAGTTHVYATTAVFDLSDVGMVISVRGVGVFTIAGYVSPTEITLTPGTDYEWIGAYTFAFTDLSLGTYPTLTATYDAGTDLTTITSPTLIFYPSATGTSLFVLDVATPVPLNNFLNNTQMTVQGDYSWAGSKYFSMVSNGVYMLPENFGGQVAGEITYQAGSNRGVPINWISELEIRRLRENWNSVSGNPYYAAVRRDQANSRRWNLYIYPNTGGTYRVEFPYIIYFDKINSLSDMHPAGFAHDELMKWAARAQAEMQGEDAMAGSTKYYREIALPNSLKIDGMSAARRLGYNGNPRSTTVALRDFRQYFRRPSVQYRQARVSTELSEIFLDSMASVWYARV